MAATRRHEVAAKQGSELFAVGQEVVIKQKTKERHGTIVKLNPCKALVEIISEGGEKQKYRVPYSMLVKEHLQAAAKAKGQPRQASAKPKPRAVQRKAKVNSAAMKQHRVAPPSEEDSDEESSDDGDDEKAYVRGFDQAVSLMPELHPAWIADMFDHRDFIEMGRKHR